MAKLTKNQLKSIVKECLVELLAEGLSSSADVMVEARQTRPSRKAAATSKRSKNHPAVDDNKFNEAATQRAASITSDPVMQSILADTARTTLQEQAGADRGRHVNMQESIEPEKNIEDDPVFAEGAQNWAALAFTDKNLP